MPYWGTFSRVMHTNARMFFRAVLPIMTMSMHSYASQQGGGLVNFGDRLAQIGSFLDLMDYAPHMYVEGNSITTVETYTFGCWLILSM